MVSSRYPVISLAVVAVLVALSGRGVFWVVRDNILLLNSRGWVTAPAIVEGATLERKRGGKGSPEYSPRVTYRFEVDGHEYHGARFEIPVSYGPKGYERGRLAPYVPGARISILYDPADPTRSVVLRPKLDYWFTFGAGSIAVLVLSFGLYAGWKIVAGMRRQPRNSPDRMSGVTAITWYWINTDLDVVERGEVDLPAALAIVDDYVARLKPKYDSGEEAHSQSTFGFSRDEDDFIEISVISPQEILLNIELPRSPSGALLAQFRGGFGGKRTLPSVDVLRHYVTAYFKMDAEELKAHV